MLPGPLLLEFQVAVLFLAWFEEELPFLAVPSLRASASGLS